MKINVKSILSFFIIIFIVTMPIISYTYTDQTNMDNYEISVAAKKTTDSSGKINPDKYKPSSDGVKNASKLKDKLNILVTALQWIGIITSVIILCIIGIKYMIGSAEEKAEYKETIIPYLIGAFLIFSVSTLPTIIFNFAKEIN